MELYKTRFQKEYLNQIGEEVSVESLNEFGLDPKLMKLMYETDDYWVIHYKDMNSVINVVYKSSEHPMDCLEIRY